ncbi:MAG: hypothetical protein LRZ84_10145 [Desertifilum sp.]|nr:hypothetical protein [Desertifilum sp.]
MLDLSFILLLFAIAIAKSIETNHLIARSRSQEMWGCDRRPSFGFYGY